MNNTYQIMGLTIVPRMGLEPTQAKAQQILSLSCLPIPPSRHHLPSQKLYNIFIYDFREFILLVDEVIN